MISETRILPEGCGKSSGPDPNYNYKNTIPNDPRSPFVTSGLRIGTPAVTTRGMKEEDMKLIAKAISLVITDFEKNKQEALDIVDSLHETSLVP